MPKKSTPVRSAAQRSKPKASKGFELVRPTTQEPELVEVEQQSENESRTDGARAERAERDANESKATATVTRERIENVENVENVEVVPQRRSRGRTGQSVQSAQRVSEFASVPAVPSEKRDEDAEDTTSTTSTPQSTSSTPAARGSASERLAARRQGSQKAQRRNVAALVTAEHYSYVRRDLKFIAILAIIMFIILAVLYFVPGI